MKKKFLLIVAMIFALDACSDNNSVEASAEAKDSSEKLSDADVSFMKTMLGESGYSQVVSDGVNLDDAVPTEGGSLSASPAAVNSFKTEPESAFSELRSTGSCWVNVYKEENGIYYSKSVKGDNPGEDSDDALVYLRENEDSLYKFESHFKLYSENAVERCEADSIAFVKTCNENGGLYKMYNRGCSAGSFEATCVTKVSANTKLETIADSLKSECETFVAELPEENVMPGEQCVGDTRHGLVCDKI
ncbi:MAG: hypothetical protein MJY85_06310 [Fibrobacter sp.]|nr:hypothetical protein [Fibrobacter sp.]